MNEPETHSVDFMLGQITAQLREMIHGQNNTNTAMRGLENSLGKRIDDLSARVATIEKANERREGAAGIIAAILKSPTLGWLVGAAVTAWVILTGKVQI